jgi:hypothetical protein
MNWYAFDDGDSIGNTGSEGGRILLDDEHPEGARITLEEGVSCATFAITCGVYGWMVHTRFFSCEGVALAESKAMKTALETVLALILSEAEPELCDRPSAVSTALEEFVQRFP